MHQRDQATFEFSGVYSHRKPGFFSTFCRGCWFAVCWPQQLATPSPHLRHSCAKPAPPLAPGVCQRCASGAPGVRNPAAPHLAPPAAPPPVHPPPCARWPGTPGSWLAGHFPWVLVWTGACYWNGVGGFMFNSPSSAPPPAFWCAPPLWCMAHTWMVRGACCVAVPSGARCLLSVHVPRVDLGPPAGRGAPTHTNEHSRAALAVSLPLSSCYLAVHHDAIIRAR